MDTTEIIEYFAMTFLSSLYSETDMKSGNYQSHRLSNFYCLWHNAGHEIADYHFKRFSCDYSDIGLMFKSNDDFPMKSPL